MAFNLIDTASRIFSSASTAAAAASELTQNISPHEHPQMAYLWEFLVRGITGEKEELKFYAQTTTVPTMSKEPIHVDYCGTSFYYQGKHSQPKKLNVRFYDNQNLDVYRFFYQWYSFMESSDEAKASVNPINYMKQAEVRLLDSTERIITEQFLFDDAFPISISDASLEYSASEVMTFDVTFQFRKMSMGYNLLDAVGDVSSAVAGVRSLF